MSGTVAFLGLGLMGEPMVRRLLAAGVPVRVWNRNPAKAEGVAAAGAVACATPAEAARGADLVLLCVTDAKAVEATLFGPDGAAETIAGGALVVDLSTIGPGPTRSLAARLAAERGAGWVDCPVTGGVPGAEAGTLIGLAGGEAAHLDRVEPVLRAFLREMRRLGPLGAGQVAKLANQLIVTVNVLAIAEALLLAERNGVDPRLIPSAFEGGWADSGPMRVIGPRMAAGVSEPRIGSVATMLKDITMAVGALGDQPDALPLTRAALALYQAAEQQGLAGCDLTALTAIAAGEPAAG